MLSLFYFYTSISQMFACGGMDSSLYQDFGGYWILRVDLMLESSTSFEIAASSNFYLHFVGKYPTVLRIIMNLPSHRKVHKI